MTYLTAEDRRRLCFTDATQLIGHYERMAQLEVEASKPVAQTCPVCESRGKLSNMQSMSYDICHGCNGKGWVTVQREAV